MGLFRWQVISSSIYLGHYCWRSYVSVDQVSTIYCCLLLHVVVYYYMFLFIITCSCLLLHVYCCLGRETEWRLEWPSRELMPGTTMILWVNYQLSALVSSSCLWQRKAAAVTQWGPLLFEIKKPLGLLPLCDTMLCPAYKSNSTQLLSKFVIYRDGFVSMWRWRW